jgi:hypothetical protein
VEAQSLMDDFDDEVLLAALDEALDEALLHMLMCLFLLLRIESQLTLDS